MPWDATPGHFDVRAFRVQTTGGDYASRVYTAADVVTRASRIVAPVLAGEAERPAR
jgi:hypothetical protein